MWRHNEIRNPRAGWEPSEPMAEEEGFDMSWQAHVTELSMSLNFNFFLVESLSDSCSKMRIIRYLGVVKGGKWVLGLRWGGRWCKGWGRYELCCWGDQATHKRKASSPSQGSRDFELGSVSKDTGLLWVLLKQNLRVYPGHVDSQKGHFPRSCVQEQHLEKEQDMLPHPSFPPAAQPDSTKKMPDALCNLLLLAARWVSHSPRSDWIR